MFLVYKVLHSQVCHQCYLNPTAPTLKPVFEERLLLVFKFAKLRVLAVASLTINKRDPVNTFKAV